MVREGVGMFDGTSDTEARLYMRLYMRLYLSSPHSHVASPM